MAIDTNKFKRSTTCDILVAAMLGCEKVLHYCFYGSCAFGVVGFVLTGVALFKATQQSEDAKILSFTGLGISSVSMFVCLGIIFLKIHFFSSRRPFDKEKSESDKTP